MREKIKPYVEARLISEQKHPETNLWIYNYTKKCQYENKWDDITEQCRGLILNSNGNVIARPFRKMFNYEEWINKKGSVPAEEFKVYEKYDGSLGILYWHNDKPYLATRGSFISDQAIKGTEMLQRDFPSSWFNKAYTYLFEIIYPENRIVLDYGRNEALILLAVINTATGEELPLSNFSSFPTALHYDGIKDIALLQQQQENNKEGYVIVFKSGLRLKVKFAEYDRLHKLVTETNSKTIWEFLKSNKPIEEILERVPDEFFVWVHETIKNLKTAFDRIEQQAKNDFSKLVYITNKKEFAEKVKDNPLKAILFKMFDKRAYANIIWDMIQPKYQKPFKREISFLNYILKYINIFKVIK